MLPSSPAVLHRSPAVYLRSRRSAGPSSRRTVVFLGDSITRGQVSSNWVAAVARRHADRPIDFVNAGVNGDLAHNLVGRLDEIVQCRPDVVTLLIGTNDVQATYSEKTERMYRRQKGLLATPTLLGYREAVSEILVTLRDGIRARVGVLQIPMLGEQLTSPMNALVDAYNSALRELVEERGGDLLEIRAGLGRLLSPDRTPPAYAADVTLVVRASLAHGILRRPWDEVSRRNGLQALTDQVHLNDRAGTVIADAVSRYVTQSVSPT